MEKQTWNIWKCMVKDKCSPIPYWTGKKYFMARTKKFILEQKNTSYFSFLTSYYYFAMPKK